MVQVAGGRRDAAVAELFGDNADVHTFGPELGGMRVAKAVGVDPFLDRRLASKPWQEHAHVGVPHPSTGKRAEHRLGAVHAPVGSDLQPAFDERPARRIEAHGPGLATLTVQNPYGSRLKIDVLREEVEGFVDPQSASIEDGDQGTVTHASGPASAGVQQAADLCIVEDLGREAAAWLAVASGWHRVARPRTSNELPQPGVIVQARRYGFVEKRTSPAGHPTAVRQSPRWAPESHPFIERHAILSLRP